MPPNFITLPMRPKPMSRTLSIADVIKNKELSARFTGVIIGGCPDIGEDTGIGYMSEIWGHSEQPLMIGAHCDIGSFVAINTSDSHRHALGISENIDYKPITIEDYVYVGSHCFIGGGCSIGHHSVIAAGTVMVGKTIPPYSLVIGGPVNLIIKAGYYEQRLSNQDG